jgi:hypothetical protein
VTRFQDVALSKDVEESSRETTMPIDDQTPRKQGETQTEPPMADSGMQWGLPLGLAATAVVLTLVFYNANHGGTTPTTTAAVQPSKAPAR